MKVKELIEELKKYDEELQILLEAQYNGLFSLEKEFIRKVKYAEDANYSNSSTVGQHELIDKHNEDEVFSDMYGEKFCRVCYQEDGFFDVLDGVLFLRGKS